MPAIGLFTSIVVLPFMGPDAEAAKRQKPLVASIQIKAPPEAVFKAIQMMRQSQAMHRKLLSYDGKVAKIKENLEGVPIYGSVECVWEELEIPFERINYKMVSSDKFKSGSGCWLIMPTSDKTMTTLELDSFLDTGLHIPFASELTKMSAAKDNKVRLEHIKDIAEELETKSEAKDRIEAQQK
jgi:hypothetical protein